MTLSKHHRNWLIICCVIGMGTIFYLSTSLNTHPKTLVMPLDDSYIHFQYARQIAAGEPFRYNPSDQPTSGDTSFVYPFLLALGIVLGFTKLSLGMWAVGIGIFAHLISTWLIYRLLLEDDHTLIPLLFALSFGISGAFFWAALSGMETTLFVCAVLLTLYAYQRHSAAYVLSIAALTTLIRPEGAVIALTSLAAILWQTHRSEDRARWWWFGLPLLAVALQPSLNYALTGSFAASGTQAKSLLYDLSVPLSVRWEAIADNKEQLWQELATGYSPTDGLYMVFLVTLPCFAAMLFGLRTSWKQKVISTGLLAALWMILLSAAVATLETAFWHFKRYQLPIMALMFPLAGWLYVRFASLMVRGDRWLFNLASVFIFLASLGTFFSFALRYHDNVMVIANQQLPLAQEVNMLPPDTLIAAHDVGMVRYIGDRDTYDVVGLTTEGAALAWRQGSGTLYEGMAHHNPTPMIFAIYPDVQSIPYLIEAGVIGDKVARFEFPLPEHTVAAASSTQIIAQGFGNSPDWSDGDSLQVYQPSTLEYVKDFELLDSLDVAYLKDEADHHYEWWNDEQPKGFVSDVRRLPYAALQGEDTLTIIEGERIITGGERFDLPSVDSDTDLLVILRAQAASPATLTAGCEGEPKQVRVVPALPAQWVEIPFLLKDAPKQFCLETHGAYYPAYYWVYAGDYTPPTPSPDPLATFSDQLVTDFTIRLLKFNFEISPSDLQLDLTFESDGIFPYDGKIFAHLYDDVNSPPLAQSDIYAGDGAQPAANWLAGRRDARFSISLADVPSGDYILAVGIYDPTTQQRFPVTSETLDNDGERLYLGEINVPK